MTNRCQHGEDGKRIWEQLSKASAKDARDDQMWKIEGVKALLQSSAHFCSKMYDGAFGIYIEIKPCTNHP